MVYVCLLRLWLFDWFVLWFVLVCFVMKLTSEVFLTQLIYSFVTKNTTEQLQTLRFSGVAQLNCRNMDILNYIL